LIELSFISGFESPFGDFSIMWRVVNDSLKILRIFLSKEEQSSEIFARAAFRDFRQQSHSMVKELGQNIQRFLEGEAIEFTLDSMALESCSPFQRRVILAEFAVPRGLVTTYGRLANHLGIEGAARAVGSALATNPFPIVIPCHRTIRSDATLGGYQGGLATKRSLLIYEGVEVSENGIVQQPRLFY